MSGPWENYAPAAAEAKPWEKYGATGADDPAPLSVTPDASLQRGPALLDVMQHPEALMALAPRRADLLPAAARPALPVASAGPVNLTPNADAAGEAMLGSLATGASTLPLAMGGAANLLGMEDTSNHFFDSTTSLRDLGHALQAKAQGTSRAGATLGSTAAILPQLLAPELLAGQFVSGGTEPALGALEKGADLPTAEKLMTLGTILNTAAGLAPVGVSANPLVRAAVGGAVGGAAGYGIPALEHAVAPDYTEAPTLDEALTSGGIGAILAAALGHGAPAVRPSAFDSILENVRNMKFSAPGTDAPLGLPENTPVNGEFRAGARPTPPPAPGEVRVTPAGEAFTPPQGKRVLAEAIDQALQSPAPAGLPEPTIAVDRQGTAKTTADQHAELAQPKLEDLATALGLTPGTLAAQAKDARTAREGAPIPPKGLPAPAIAVDKRGTAMTSADFMRRAQEARQASEERRALGITPDIERSQGVRWAKQRQAAESEAERQARLKELDDAIAAREAQNKPARGINAKPDETVDDALTFLAKQGGLERRALIQQGLDPVLAKARENLTRGGASRPLFRAQGNGGMSLDDAARTLWQHGYLDSQDNNAALDLILSGVNQGEPTYSIHRAAQDDLMQLQQARRDAENHVVDDYADVPFSFAGERARTADRGALEQAKAMEAMGRDSVPDRYGNQPGSPEDTHIATGWHRGVDGKWRFEIDDSAAKVAKWKIGLGEPSRLGDVLDHPGLMAAYPELADVRVRVNPEMSGLGSYYGKENVIEIRPPADYRSSGDSSLKSVLLHEIQHAIQNHEGFARGGSSAEARTLPEFEQALRQQMAERGGELPPFEQVKPSKPDEIKAAQAVYRRLAGEVEARNTQRRLPMDAEQRRATPPTETADVPRSQQIVRFNADRAMQEEPSHAESDARHVERYNARLSDYLGAPVHFTPAAHVPDAARRALDAFDRAYGGRTIVIRNDTPDTLDLNGVTLRDGVRLVNEDATSPLLTVAGHEMLHQLRKDAQDLYRELVDEVRRQGRLHSYEAVLTERAKASGEQDKTFSRNEVEEELTADATGDALSDPDFLERMAQRNPGLFRELADRLRAFFDSLVQRLRRSLGSSNFLDDVEAFRTKLADVLERYAERQQGEAAADPERAPGQALARKTDADRTLVAVHNTTGEKVLHALRMGGMAVPSIAVTRADRALTNFGDITLLAHPDLVDPKQGAKAFGADIYSPRYPSVDYKITPAVERALNRTLEPFGGIGGSWEHVGNDALDSLTRDKAFQRYVADKTGGEAATVPHHVLKDEAQMLLREAGAQERLFKGYTANGRSYKPHTLENVVAILKKELRGGENFNYGVGSLRAHFTPQFRSMAQIRNAKDRLTDKATFDKVKEEVDTEFFGLVDALRPHYRHGDGNRFGFADTVISALTDAAKIGVPRALREYGIDGVDEATQRQVAEFLGKLRTLPTEYFEVKQLRGVGVHEFQAAVVPDDTSPKVRTALEQAGLKLIDYPRGDDAARQRAVHEFVHGEGDALRFSRKPADDQTQTPAFRKWFGDSKVVDAEGKPLVVYHGTGNAFDEFRQGAGKGAGGYSSRLGYFFTDSPEVASSYADESVEFERTRGYERSMQLERRGRYDEASALERELESPEFRGGMSPNVVPTYLSIQNPKVVDFGGRAYDAERDNLSEIISDAKAEGHDGVILRNLDDAPRQGFAPSDHYVAFQPSQVKSATGNRGTFDPEEPSILFSRKPAPGSTTPADLPSRRPGESQAAYARRVTRKSADQIKLATELAKRQKTINRQLLRAKMAGEARALATADAALTEARKAFDKTPDVINYASVHQFETGQPIADADFRAFAKTMQDGFDKRIAEIHRLAPDALKSLIEHYMPHLYQDSGKAIKWYQGVMGKRPLDGDKSFLKQRTWPTLKEAMASGLKPISPNPVDWVLMKYHQMDKFIGLLRYREELQKRGWILKMEAGQRAPEGFARVDNPAFQIAGGLQGHYVVPEGMARDINTLLAPGLEQYGAWRSFRAAQNALVSANLGFSAFHAAFTSTDNVVTHFGVGLNRLAMGDLAGGIRHVLEAVPTIAVGPFHGAKLNRQWLGQKAVDPHTAALLDLLEQGGARYKNAPDLVSYNNALPSIARGLRRLQAPGYLPDRADDLRRQLALDGPLATGGKVVWEGAKGIGRAFSAVGELGSYAIHHVLVPNQKMAARITLLKMELDRYAEQLGKRRGDYAGIVQVMHPDVARQLASEVVDRVDFRLGQMIYDNFFVPKIARQVAQALLLAPGWLAGGVQTAVGGVRDLPRLVKPAKLVAPLDRAGTITDAHRGRIGNNLTSLAALFLIVGGANAVFQYLMTGEGPRELRDLVAPRTGRKNADDSDERITSPNYLKDHYELVKHPLATLGHKLNPSLRMLRDLAYNEDYFGNMIRDPHHGAGQQAKEIAAYILKGMLPLSVQNVQESRANGDSAGQMAAGFFGFNPAPASLNRSAFQAFVAKGGAKGWDFPAATPAEAEYQDRRRAAEHALRTGQTPDLSGLDPRDVATLKRKVRTPTPELQFDRLGLADKLDAYEMATPAERQRYHLTAILARTTPQRSVAFRRLPEEERRALLARLARIRREAAHP